MIRCVRRSIVHESRADVFTVVPLGDIHLGNEACNEKLLAETIKRIADDPHCYWVGMGDYCDFINRNDKRHDEESLPQWLWGIQDLAAVQRDRIIDYLTPIAPKCLGLVEGNHERDIRLRWERDVYTVLAEKLGTRCIGPMGFVRLSFARSGMSKHTITLFATHGWWAGRLMGAGALNLERIVGWTNADVVLAGHDHKRRAFPLTRLVALDKDSAEERVCWAVSTGAFLDGARYAQEKGYMPSVVGSPEIIITPDKRTIKVLQ